MSWIRWPWPRRKASQTTTTATRQSPTDGAVTTVARSETVSGRLSNSFSNREPCDELLRFARDTLNAQGARVRVEEDDLVIATLPAGGSARYTTTLARARAEDATVLLAEGSAALTALFDEAAQHTRLLALDLGDGGDPVAIALAGVAQLAPHCGRCVGLGGSPARLHATDTPHCAACPLRDGRIVLRREPAGPAAPSTSLQATVTRRWVAESIELTWRVGSSDRQGRHDEWLRIAVDPATGRGLASLTLEQSTGAQAGALNPPDSATLRTGQTQAQSLLAPALDAASVFLQQRTADAYQRRIADVTIQHERLRREQPDQAREITATLERELASIGEVYAIEVEARLEGACLIRSTMAEVALTSSSSSGQDQQAVASLTVDVGRGVVLAPTCIVCGKPTQVAIVCPNGDTLCGDCAQVCASCGRVRCQHCAEATPATTATLTACATCGELTCAACTHACDVCGQPHCSGHLWACKGGDRSLCLRCAALCKTCDAPLCEDHMLTCGVCEDALCMEHALACKQCGQMLCVAHASQCVTCHAPLCATHALACAECGQTMCTQDTFACVGCGRQLCSCAAPTTCATCQITYCSQCRGATDSCPACRSLADATEADLVLLQCAAEHNPTINPRRSWQAGHNARATVFVSRGVGRRSVVVVAPDGEIVGTHATGWLGR
ncbi:MAG: hypothetical protein ABI068_12070 [Ktedonobacterales bacterium]